MIELDDGDLGRPMTAQEAPVNLGIPAGTVRSWHNRRDSTQLHPMGRDNGNRPLFWEVDLLALKQGKRIRDECGRRIVTMEDVR